MKTRAIAIIMCEIIRIGNKAEVVVKYRGKKVFKRDLKRQNQ